MEQNTYGKGVTEIVKYILNHRNTWITDSDLIELSPKFGERIINELLVYQVLTSTKDGVCFYNDNIDALKRYLRHLGVNIE